MGVGEGHLDIRLSTRISALGVEGSLMPNVEEFF